MSKNVCIMLLQMWFLVWCTFIIVLRCGTLGMPTPNIISLASKLCQSQCLRSLYLTAILHNVHYILPLLQQNKATETRLGVHDGHFTTKSFVKSKAVSALFCCESRSFSRISRTVKSQDNWGFSNHQLCFFFPKIARTVPKIHIVKGLILYFAKNTVPV